MLRIIPLLLAAIVMVPARPISSQQPAIAVVDVTVIDGTGAPPRPNTTVLIADGRIVALGPAAQVASPPQALRIDGRGKFLIPGLWDMHAHLAKTGSGSLGVFVANGVTSVRDMGGDFDVVQGWRADIAAGNRIGPRIRTAGPILESAERVERMRARGVIEPVHRFRVPIAGERDARRAVDSLASLGVDFIKVRTVASPETYRAIASAVRDAGLTLAAHGDIVPLEEMLHAGQASIEHGIQPSLQKRDEATRTRLMDELARREVAIVPTMVTYFEWLRVSPRRAMRVVNDSLAQLDPRRRYISGYLLEDWREQVVERGGGPGGFLARVMDAIIGRLYLPSVFRGVQRDLQQMHRAGVRILPGTDAAVALIYPGFTLRDELGYFVDRIGMTPMEALVSATRYSAEFSGMADVTGTVEIGKLADVVLLDADPLTDIRNVGSVAGVILRGEYLDSSRLAQLLESAAE